MSGQADVASAVNPLGYTCRPPSTRAMHYARRHEPGHLVRARKGTVKASIWSPLRLPDFRKLWLGQLVSVVGDKLHQIAMGVMVYVITGSPVQMGIMLAMTALPALLFGLAAGAYVDRWDKRLTMVFSDLVAGGARAARAVRRRRERLPCVRARIRRGDDRAVLPAGQADPRGRDRDRGRAARRKLARSSQHLSRRADRPRAPPVRSLPCSGYTRAFWLDSATFLFSAGAIALIRYRPQRESASEVRVPRSSPPR